MTVSKPVFFLFALLITTAPFLVPKISWLAHSKTAIGTMRFVGKAYTGQLIHFYSFVSFPVANDTVWFRSSDNTIFEIGEKVPVIYQANSPEDAKVNIFSNVWADTVVYGAIPLIILLMLFFHPKGIPRNTKLYLGRQKPFIRISSSAL